MFQNEKNQRKFKKHAKMCQLISCVRFIKELSRFHAVSMIEKEHYSLLNYSKSLPVDILINICLNRIWI